MTLYDSIIEKIREIEEKTKKEARVTNISTSAVLTAELTIVSTIFLVILMIRKVNIYIMVLVLLLMGFMLISMTPITVILRREQTDSFHKMIFYVILTFGVLITLLYWGNINV
ncbi:energy-converting hydrogenase B subunit G, EhbG [Methanothermobacter tenebrarum]|uniref:Energy-converting hydrogenase B subunit G, EhbG n=1 Tax=Methanothermobacter tenebrarum TaxID=680118 RepID=A0A328PIU5_9EURY|nr:energy-converting hydrogenase B subunit G, EhbG [Methanothermobacter tenebrarum]MBC7101446.1 energy-converting hydrogenase B subunit G, EhbG [Methanobacteriales archaeon]NPV65257.1 energy-converting hydrogenase B subunit G, EhbG [Methanobacteriaceae archaeon]RAO79616.1 energy-converting hydrogenase B subunit G, EhbG [Methanothermobacter tenebrarum]